MKNHKKQILWATFGQTILAYIIFIIFLKIKYNGMKDFGLEEIYGYLLGAGVIYLMTIGCYIYQYILIDIMLVLLIISLIFSLYVSWKYANKKNYIIYNLVLAILLYLPIILSIIINSKGCVLGD